MTSTPAINSFSSPELTPATLPIRSLPPLGSPAAAQDPPPAGFGTVLNKFISEVNDKQALAGKTMKGLINGENVSLHQAVIAMEEANVSFQLMVEVRNKLLESYQELIRMQI